MSLDAIASVRSAAQTGHLDAVRVLLDAGAAPDGGGTQRTPLSAAERAGHTAVADLLRSRGATRLNARLRAARQSSGIDVYIANATRVRSRRHGSRGR